MRRYYAGLALGIVKNPGALVSLPPSIAPTAFQLDLFGALKQNLIAVIFIFFFLDLFDTVGSLIGIAKQADLMKEGKLARAGRALLADGADSSKSRRAARPIQRAAR